MTQAQMPAVQGGVQLPALPAHLRTAPAAGTSANADLKAGLTIGISVPRISTKGSKFRVVIDGVEKLVTSNGEPVTFLNVAIVGANKGRYKTFYGYKAEDGAWYPEAYDPAAEATAPTCYSYDGERPSPFAPNKQCETCAACPQNVFGSHVTQQGNETRACSDGKLLAVIPITAVKAKIDPVANPAAARAYLLRVPPTGLSRNREDRKADPTNNTSLVEYMNLLDRYPTGDGREIELPVTSVITKIFLDHNTEYALPRFKLQGFLEPDEIAYIEMRRAGDDIKAIVTEEGRRGQGPIAPAAPAIAPPPSRPALPPATPAAPAQAAPQARQPAPAASRPAPAPRTAPAPVQTAPAAPAGDPDNVSFGDPEPAPAAASAGAQAPAAAPRGRGRPRNPPAPAAAPQAPAAAAPATSPPAQAQVVDDPSLDEIAGMFG